MITGKVIVVDNDSSSRPAETAASAWAEMFCACPEYGKGHGF
ncbi:hypothetical protein ACSAZL_21750 [Methanosarcina sp. T3]